MLDIWKELGAGRERLVYAMGVLYSACGDSMEDAITTVCEIIEDTIENCSIYENRKADDSDE